MNSGRVYSGVVRKPPTADDYVGYGHPPKKHQFQPGVSGNLCGRPKKKKSLDGTDFRAALFDEPLTITENGKRRKITVLDAIRRMLQQQALTKANTRILLRLMDMALVWERERAAKRRMDTPRKLEVVFVDPQGREYWEPNTLDGSAYEKRDR